MHMLSIFSSNFIFLLSSKIIELGYLFFIVHPCPSSMFKFYLFLFEYMFPHTSPSLFLHFQIIITWIFIHGVFFLLIFLVKVHVWSLGLTPTWRGKKRGFFAAGLATNHSTVLGVCSKATLWVPLRAPCRVALKFHPHRLLERNTSNRLNPNPFYLEPEVPSPSGRGGGPLSQQPASSDYSFPLLTHSFQFSPSSFFSPGLAPKKIGCTIQGQMIKSSNRSSFPGWKKTVCSFFLITRHHRWWVILVLRAFDQYPQQGAPFYHQFRSFARFLQTIYLSASIYLKNYVYFQKHNLSSSKNNESKISNFRGNKLWSYGTISHDIAYFLHNFEIFLIFPSLETSKDQNLTIFFIKMSVINYKIGVLL